MHRFIEIEGVHNFRDFGGSETKNNTKIKNGILFRSGQLSKIKANGLEKLNQIAPKTVIDLRRTKERLEQPNNFGNIKIETISGLEIHDDGGALPPHMQYIASGKITYEATREHMLGTYQKMPYLPQHEFLFKEAFKSLAKNQAPIIIHCAAGKDRTGLLCALILKVLGVDDDKIKDDYLLTNKIPNIDEIIKSYADKLGKRFNVEVPIKEVWPLGAVNAEYLDAALEIIDKKSGGAINYLNQIGVDDKDIEEIQKHLIQT